jgi:hypothetical protein
VRVSGAARSATWPFATPAASDRASRGVGLSLQDRYEVGMGTELADEAAGTASFDVTEDCRFPTADDDPTATMTTTRAAWSGSRARGPTGRTGRGHALPLERHPRRHGGIPDLVWLGVSALVLANRSRRDWRGRGIERPAATTSAAMKAKPGAPGREAGPVTLQPPPDGTASSCTQRPQASQVSLPAQPRTKRRGASQSGSGAPQPQWQPSLDA